MAVAIVDRCIIDGLMQKLGIGLVKLTLEAMFLEKFR